jgi:signal transduction histidine kinase
MKLDEEATELRLGLRDATISALIAIEAQIDILRRRASAEANPLAPELGRIQGLIREEVLKLRELMQQISLSEIDSSNFLGFLNDTVERFGRETGISARFVSELDELKMPQRVCGKLARIVQDGLLHVSAMRRTRHVEVRLTATDSHWQLTIEDDGLPLRKELAFMREQVHALDGTLNVESGPESSRMVVTVPQTCGAPTKKEEGIA